MKIAQITPGSGDNFYCENCLRDAALVTAIRKLEHDTLLLPMYLPMQVDEKDVPRNAPIFFGGINVYLQQKLDLFQKDSYRIVRTVKGTELEGLEYLKHDRGELARFECGDEYRDQLG